MEKYFGMMKIQQKQVDNSHLGIVIQQYFSKDVFISADYREELSNGAVLAGVRHSQRVFDLRYNKKTLQALLIILFI